MVFFVDLFEVGVGDMGVNLSRGDVAVAEHGLDTSDVCTIA